MNIFTNLISRIHHLCSFVAFSGFGNAKEPVIIYRGGGGGLVQIRGGSPFFMQKFKGGPQENMQMYKPITC